MTRTLARTLCSLSLFAPLAAEATLIERSVELDLLQLDLPSRSFATTLDFDDAVLDVGDRLVLDILFVNGELGVFRDPSAFSDWVYFTFFLQGTCDSSCDAARVTPSLLGTTGGLQSDSLMRFDSPVAAFTLTEPDRSELYGNFSYSGVRYETEFRFFSGTVSSFYFRQHFFAPHGGDSASMFYRVPESVPEPATLSLLGAGFLGLLLRRRSRVSARSRADDVRR